MLPLKTQRVNSVFTVNTSRYDCETNVINYLGTDIEDQDEELEETVVQNITNLKSYMDNNLVSRHSANNKPKTDSGSKTASRSKTDSKFKTNSILKTESKYNTESKPPKMEATDSMASLTSVEELQKVENVWIFGYGSLVWKVDFPYAERCCGHIKGFVRRFYQHSIDHRGTKDKPGRVVTLLPAKDPQATVWGVAYRISTEKVEEVLKQLDYREKNGYIRCIVNFFPYNATTDELNEVKRIILYVATELNESFAGPADIATIGDEIYDACGPSGSNREYVYKLAESMRSMYPGLRDDHLFGIEAILKYREKYETVKDVFKNTLPKSLLTAILNAEEEGITLETIERIIYREIERHKRQDAEHTTRKYN